MTSPRSRSSCAVDIRTSSTCRGGRPWPSGTTNGSSPWPTASAVTWCASPATSTGCTPSRRPRRRGPRPSTGSCACCGRTTCPCVEPVGLVRARDNDGAAALITRYLDYSLPYWYVIGREAPTSTDVLLDAAVVLLVRLHLSGVFWGDCSPSNILFRRDAGAMMAYLVDAETAEVRAVDQRSAAGTRPRDRPREPGGRGARPPGGGTGARGRRPGRHRRRPPPPVRRRSGRS